jgi:hypothetical protein
MARWMIFVLVGTCLVLSPGLSSSTLAQTTSAAPAGQVTVVQVTAVAVAALPAIQQTPAASGQYRSTLVLTLEDNGRTFTVPVGALILLHIPRAPFYRLVYDPTILQLIDVQPLPDQPAPNDGGGQSFPAPGWRLVAIRPGITSLSVEQQPCRVPPCPMIPVFNFRVTIVVSGISDVTPVPPLVHSDIYIGTAYLNQTVVARVGQVITLELPFLSPGRPVRLQFNSAVLRPLPGQNLNYPQPGGWHFVVAQPGTTSLVVYGDACIDGGFDCQPAVLFQVIVTTEPPGFD